MKKIFNFFMVLGFLFGLTLLLYAIIQMMLYNGLGQHYSFNCIKPIEAIVQKNNTYVKISYTYNIGTIDYNDSYEISNELYYKNIHRDKIIICYNVEHPKFSYIEGANLAIRKAKVGVVVSLIFIAFLIFIILFSNKEYWFKKYQDFYDKLE